MVWRDYFIIKSKMAAVSKENSRTPALKAHYNVMQYLRIGAPKNRN
jgi:hypothetical protein